MGCHERQKEMHILFFNANYGGMVRMVIFSQGNNYSTGGIVINTQESEYELLHRRDSN